MNTPLAPYCLVYISQATHDFEDDELSHLLVTSRRNNARHGITGLLMYESRLFMQALEGPRPAVESLFQRIKRDPRHTDVHIICEDHIQNRNFGPWRMAFRRAAELDSSSGDGFSSILENYRQGTLSHLDGRLVFAMLILFKERLPIEDIDPLL
jgi:hypothetical protein